MNLYIDDDDDEAEAENIFDGNKFSKSFICRIFIFKINGEVLGGFWKGREFPFTD